MNLCLNTHAKKRHLPIGDRLASLVLSLHNDVKLAMDIPLVAQFIVCPREDLLHIYAFQDDMIVTQDMIENHQDFDEDYDLFEDDEIDQFEEEIMSPMEDWFADNSEDAGVPDLGQRNWSQDLGEFIMQQFERSKSGS